MNDEKTIYLQPIEREILELFVKHGLTKDNQQIVLVLSHLTQKLIDREISNNAADFRR